jgi:hypothetical protein
MRGIIKKRTRCRQREIMEIAEQIISGVKFKKRRSRCVGIFWILWNKSYDGV